MKPAASDFRLSLPGAPDVDAGVRFDSQPMA
jgi:hypothetical protein